MRKAKPKAETRADAGEPLYSGRVTNPVELNRLIDDIGELAVLPQVVAKVLELSSEPTACATDFDRAISVDPGFTARILKLANSAYYGLPRRVGVIRDAVVLLGVKEVRCLALAATGFDLFVGKSDRDSLVKREMWRHSVYTASAARAIAQTVPGVQSEEAFVTGLLHDIGKSVALRALRQEFMDTLDRAQAAHLSFFEGEQQTMRYSHTDLGAAVMMKWNLPRRLTEAVACHHEPERATENPTLTAAIAVADSIINFLAAQDGTDGGELVEDLSEMRIAPKAMEVLNMDHAGLFRAVVECASHVSSAAALYSVAA
jgi:putative nucleotidyltransferase with HDIG domain